MQQVVVVVPVAAVGDAAWDVDVAEAEAKLTLRIRWRIFDYLAWRENDGATSGFLGHN